MIKRQLYGILRHSIQVNWRILLEQILLHAYPCWQKVAHSDYDEDAGVLTVLPTPSK